MYKGILLNSIQIKFRFPSSVSSFGHVVRGVAKLYIKKNIKLIYIL